MAQISLRNEIYRKLFHILLVIIPLTYCSLGKWISVTIFAAAAAIVVSLDYSRRKNLVVQNIFVKLFGIILREHERNGNNLCGASWVALAATINFLFFPAEIAVAAFFILAISDASAAIIGRNFPSEPFFEKTKNGTLAFFISALIILVSCGMFYHSSFWYYFFGVFAVIIVTLLEARPSFLRIDDNFLIPIGFSTTMMIFNVMWNFSY